MILHVAVGPMVYWADNAGALRLSPLSPLRIREFESSMAQGHGLRRGHRAALGGGHCERPRLGCRRFLGWNRA